MLSETGKLAYVPKDLPPDERCLVPSEDTVVAKGFGIINLIISGFFPVDEIEIVDSITLCFGELDVFLCSFNNSLNDVMKHDGERIYEMVSREGKEDRQGLERQRANMELKDIVHGFYSYIVLKEVYDKLECFDFKDCNHVLYQPADDFLRWKDAVDFINNCKEEEQKTKIRF